MDKKHTQLFEQFSATFQPNTIIAWEKLINAWKKNRSQPNPYLESDRLEEHLEGSRTVHQV